MLEWLRKAGAALIGTADKLEGLDDKAKAAVTWIKVRYTVCAFGAGVIIGFIWGR